MNKAVSVVIILIVLGVGGFFLFNNYIYNEKQREVLQEMGPDQAPTTTNESSEVLVTPITHASAVLKWGDYIIYTDPTGGEEAYIGQPEPNIVLVTDIHGDHLDAETLSAVLKDGSLIVPQAVKDMLPEDLKVKAKVLANGQTIAEQDFSITGVPMYNLPEASDSRHTRGRGNGYVIEKGGTRVYIAGDTSGTPEMKALTDIDVAFVPMNLPFTMGVEEAAQAVLAFKPATVYPYHYRGQDGLADTNKFKELVNAGDPNINVVLLNWYPGD